MSAIDQAARFWAKIFGISFVFGVVTGIPMEFQFGTNWSHFSKFAGGVIGQTLAMEGTFAFFLESAFLGLFLLRREAPEQDRSLVDRRRRFLRLMAVGVLHHRHRRLDAASGCLPRDCGWFGYAEQFLGTAAESLGALAICAQHGRRSGYGRIRDGGRRCLLPPQ